MLKHRLPSAAFFFFASLCLATLPAVASPTTPAPKPAAASATSVPDYGARNSPVIPLADQGADAPSPLAQMGRTILALAVVLGGVYGVMFLLKRAGYTGSGPVGPALVAGLRSVTKSGAPVPTAPAPSYSSNGPSLVLVQSQTLPGGGAVHLLAVNENTLFLVGSTGQNVSRLAEWDWEEETASEPSVTSPSPKFAECLESAETPPLPVRSAGEWAPAGRLSDLLAEARQSSRGEAKI